MGGAGVGALLGGSPIQQAPPITGGPCPVIQGEVEGSPQEQGMQRALRGCSQSHPLFAHGTAYPRYSRLLYSIP